MSSPKLAIPKGSLVLVTGATGYIGSWITHEFVKQGYRVRASVRSQEKADALASIIEKSFGSGHFESSVVTDFTSPDGYAEAIKNVDAIVHVATDVSFGADPDVVVKNTVAATKGLLALAKKTPSVKRVVLTSSSVALGSPDQKPGFVFSDKVWNDDAVDKMYEAKDPFITYAASKTLGEKAFWEGDAQFVRNTVLPSFTIGPVVGDKFRSSTGLWLKGLWENEEEAVATMKMLGPRMYWVNVEDIARLHVGATIFEEVQNKRLLGFTGKYSFNEVIDYFRGLDAKRPLPEKMEESPEDESTADVSESLKVLKLFGREEFVGYDETVKANIA